MNSIRLSPERSEMIRLADELIERAGFTGPPIDLNRLAEALCVPVEHDPTLKVRGKIVGEAGRAKIILGPAERPEREQSALGHELAEYVRAEIRAKLGRLVDEELEKWCDVLMAYLLTPAIYFDDVRRQCGGCVYRIKKSFSTASHELIANRLVEYEDDPAVLWVVDNNRWRKSVTTQHWSLKPTKLEEEVQRIANASGEFERREDGALSVRCWPVHEPGWQRELIITTMAAYW